MNLRTRLIITACVFVLASLVSYLQLSTRNLAASDFEYPLRAAHRLLGGLDIYNDPSVGPGHPYPNEAQFPYPIFAAIAAIPFTIFPPFVAGALFVGTISACLAFAVTRDGYWRLSYLLSPSYFVAISVANWTPLALAAAFLPALYPVAMAKPTLMAPIFIRWPNRVAFAVGLMITVATVAIWPSWVPEWIFSAIHQPGGRYRSPLFASAGLVVLVAFLLVPRHPSARLLLFFALIPQHPFFYDQFVLWLIPETLGQSLALSTLTWPGYIAWFALHGGNILLASTQQGPGIDYTGPMFYLPTTAIVLWQARFRIVDRWSILRQRWPPTMDHRR